MDILILLLLVLFMVLAFTFTNGFHDAANAIATAVATKVLTPRQAVIWAAIWDFTGAMCGLAVAKTIGAGLVDTVHITLITVLCAMIAGTLWNLLTWYFGLPTSSSHSLIGGLLGAALGSAGTWKVIKWSGSHVDPQTGKVVLEGVYYKVVIPMITSPIAGFVGGFIIMGILFVLVRPLAQRFVNHFFGRMQLASSTYMAWAHGFSDGQKTMGIMALAMYAATQSGQMENLPDALKFLHTPKFEVAPWVRWVCALAMAFGTYTGGWKIISTMGHKLVRLKPINGFAAETTGATILVVAGWFGMPISTTHSITTAIMGVGCAKRFGALDWVIVERIIWAWVLTIPTTAAIAYGLVRLLGSMGWH